MEIKKLSEVTELIKRGVTPKYVENNGIIVINQKCIRDNRIDFKFARLTSKEKKITEEKVLIEGDILINSTGTGTLGRTAQINEVDEMVTVDTHVTIVRPVKDINHKFLGYFIRLNEPLITSMGKGATNQIELAASDLGNIDIMLPNRKQQDKIVDILSAYDDLIENNLKRIELLEEMGEIIYKEWFVNFRFPEYEKYKFLDGVPSNWSQVKIKELGNVITGKTPSTKIAEYYGEEVPFIKTPDMSDGVYVVKTNQMLSEAGAKTQENKFIPEDAILVSCIGTLGVVALAKESSQFNQQINAIVCNKKEYIYYLYFKFKSLKEYLEALGSNGATMGNVNKNKFENIEILKPDDRLLEKYNGFSEVIFKEILNLQLSNEKLKEARDILIPKLIMGEIEV